jgi:hypothetical protein
MDVVGTTTKTLGMVRDMITNIEGFKFRIVVIVVKDNKDQECPQILERSFMDLNLIDLKNGQIRKMRNKKTYCLKVWGSKSHALNGRQPIYLFSVIYFT